MRRLFFFWLLVAAAVISPPALADDSAPGTDNVVQEFSGGGTTTTAFFTVKDRWEVRWNARQVVSVAVMSSDGTIVAGAAGVLRGSLFVPLGGQFYLKVTDGTVPATPAPVVAPSDTTTNAAPVAMTNAPPVAETNAAPIVAETNAPPAATNAAPIVASTNTPAGTNAAPVVAVTNAPPAAPTPPADADVAPAAPVEISWHLQIIQVDASVAADQALTVYTPFFVVPDSAVAPVAAPAVLPPPVLSDDQAHTVVTIKGDNAQGTGFLMRSPEGTFVVTHTHLLAANPNIKVLTSSGAEITTLALKCATDRDIAMFAIEDNQYSYLPSPSDAPNSLPAGDQLIIPDVGASSEILVGKPGRVIGTNAERIDFDNPMGPGSSGAPVIHVKSGTVVGLVTGEKRVDVSQFLAQAWRANPAPGSSAIIPYYGLRLGGVAGWETYDPARFLQETMFLKQVHENTRQLDSYLNGRRRRFGDGDNGPPDARLYLNNIKLRKAQDDYKQIAAGADQNQRLEGAHELLFDLEGFAETDLDTLQATQNFYGYDQTLAKEEVAYRLALKKELKDLGNNLVRFDNIARSH